MSIHRCRNILELIRIEHKDKIRLELDSPSTFNFISSSISLHQNVKIIDMLYSH